jgi:hypothetical protein
MKLHQTLFGLCSFASMLLIATQAYSGPGDGGGQSLDPPDFDRKSYRATGCHSQPSETVVYNLYGFSGICNPSSSTSDLEVFCPIVRDNAVDEEGAVIVVNVAVNAFTPVECTARSWGSSFTLVDEVTAPSPGPAFQSILLLLEESDPGGSYSLSCILPPDGSCILSYDVYEWERSLDNMTDYNR